MLKFLIKRIATNLVVILMKSPKLELPAYKYMLLAALPYMRVGELILGIFNFSLCICQICVFFS